MRPGCFFAGNPAKKPSRSRFSQQLLHAKGNRQSTPYQPQVQNRPGSQRLWPRLANLAEASFHTQCSHGHGQGKSVEAIDRLRHATRQYLQRIHQYQGKEAEGEPGHRNAPIALRLISLARAADPQADNQQYRHQQHHPGHLDDSGDMGGFRADITGCAHHLGDFVDSAAQKQPRSQGVQVQPAGVDGQRVQEHRQGAEQHHAADGHGALVRGTAQCRLEGQHGGGTADGAASGGQQGGIAVQLEQFHAAPQADQQGAGHHQQRHDKARPADFGNFLQADPQAKEGHGDAQQAAGRKVDAGCPAGRYTIAQGIAVEAPATMPTISGLMPRLAMAGSAAS